MMTQYDPNEPKKFKPKGWKLAPVVFHLECLDCGRFVPVRSPEAIDKPPRCVCSVERNLHALRREMSRGPTRYT